MAAYKNLDTLKAHAELTRLASRSLSLKSLLTPARVKDSQVAYQLGDCPRPAVKAAPSKEILAYNWAAKAVDADALKALQALADEAELIAKYDAITAGEMMNTGEKRLVLHHLVRGQVTTPVNRDGKNLGAFYAEQVGRIAAFARDVHAGKIVSESGKKFDTVVQVGIGGSDLGPRALFLALQTLVKAKGSLKLDAKFLSNVDPDDAADVLKSVNPETTLFILVSKSGTTQETLTNETLVLNHLASHGVRKGRRHMICVTSETSPLAKSSEYLASFFIDDYIGGRYSGTSAVGGAILSLAFGPEVFAEILAGAHAADVAAREKDIRKNPALLDALIGLWERTYLGFPSTAVLPYSQALSRFPAHLQQLDMESNGKQVNRDSLPVNYVTGPVIFGEPGTNGQHSFYQLLHQGTDIVPLQFIGFRLAQDGMDVDFEGSTSQAKLNANLVAQIVAFASGSPSDNLNKNFPGGRPASLLHADQLTPRILGALLAHFENKVMFQGLAWNLNSFDQEGVQLGKVLTNKVLKKDGASPELLEFATLMGL